MAPTETANVYYGPPLFRIGTLLFLKSDPEGALHKGALASSSASQSSVVAYASAVTAEGRFVTKGRIPSPRNR